MAGACAGWEDDAGHQFRCRFREEPSENEFDDKSYCRFHLPMGELGEGGVQRAVGGLEDVDLVDDSSVNDADAEMNLRFRVNGGEEFLADFLGELFGILQPSAGFGEAFGDPLDRQHRRRRHDRPGERAAPGFVHTS